MKNIIYFLILGLILASPSHAADDCDEFITIDSVEYLVGDYWCGKKIDTNLFADPTKLARLPEELCFLDYRIYVRPETKKALMKLAEAAKKDSVFFTVKSGFRSSRYQIKMIKTRFDEGKTWKQIKKYVAPIGYSEHATGYALDLSSDSLKFKNSTAYVWLKENGKRFGFIETYPKNNDTLAPWEPWHWTYQR